MPAPVFHAFPGDPIKFVKYLCLVIAGDPDSRVRDTDCHCFGAFIRTDGDGASGIGVLDCVGQQVIDGNSQHILVDLDRNDIVRNIQFKFQLSAACAALHCLCNVFDQINEFDPLPIKLQSSHLDLIHAQQVVDQP